MGNSCIGIINTHREDSYTLETSDRTGYISSIDLSTVSHQIGDRTNYCIKVLIGLYEFDLSKIVSFKFKLDCIVGDTFYEVRYLDKTGNYEFVDHGVKSELSATDLYKRLQHLIFNIGN